VPLIGLVLVQRLGVDPTKEQSWAMAVEGQMPTASSYSPLPYLIIRAWQFCFGPGLISAFIFQCLLLAISLCLYGWLAWRLFARTAVVIIGVSITVFSPYLIWNVYVGRDVALDLFAVSVFMFIAVRLFQRGTWQDAVALGCAGALATCIREPQVLLLPLMAVALLIWRRISWLQFGLALTSLTAGLIPLLSWNYHATGAVTLSTRLGINMYYGQHPCYLLGHPRYDIDGFLKLRVLAEKDQMGAFDGPVEENRLLLRKAIGFIRANPMEFIYRTTLKSLWWFGPTRIPGSDAAVHMDPLESKIIIVRPGSQVFKELLYTWHRMTVLFLASAVFWLVRTGSRQRFIFLLLPLLAPLPAVLLTFPDTRFRLALDPYTYLVAAAGAYLLWLLWKGSAGSVKKHIHQP
jgi:4-amino-4-deoxy-L-arabinose transferase-like glycosyltransferase